MVHMRGHAGTVIKAGDAGPLLRGLSRVDLADHLREAREVVQAAEARMARLAAEAKADGQRQASEARERGTTEGYADGLAQGRTEGRAQAYKESLETFERQHARVVAGMAGVIEHFEQMKEKLRIAAERDVLEFAVRLACSLTCQIGRSLPDAAVENVKRALQLVGKQTDVTIRLHPRDVELVETYASALHEKLDGSSNIAVVADESMTAGGCIVQTERTVVDATLETQLAEICSLLLGEAVDRARTDAGTPSENDRD